MQLLTEVSGWTILSLQATEVCIPVPGLRPEDRAQLGGQKGERGG